MDTPDPLRDLQHAAFTSIPLRLIGLSDDDTVASLEAAWRAAFEILAAATVAVLMDAHGTPFTKTTLVSELDHDRLAGKAGIPVEKSIHLAESIVDALFAQAASGRPLIFGQDGSIFRISLDTTCKTIRADPA